MNEEGKGREDDGTILLCTLSINQSHSKSNCPFRGIILQSFLKPHKQNHRPLLLHND